MSLRTGIAIALLSGALTVGALACSTSGDDSTGLTSTPSQDPTATSAPDQPADLAMVPVLAPIDGGQVRIAESFPPQYFLAVSSGLPNGCVQFDGYDVARDGDTIRVTVTNLKPADTGIFCTQVYGTVESNIALGSDFEPGKTYTVVVNDVTETFVAQ